MILRLEMVNLIGGRVLAIHAPVRTGAHGPEPVADSTESWVGPPVACLEQPFAFIQAFSGKHAYPPTVREIGDAIGIGSTSVVDYNLRKLAQKGVLRRVGAISRGIELAADLAPTLPTPIRRVPVVGTVAAGAPIDAIASADD